MIITTLCGLWRNNRFCTNLGDESNIIFIVANGLIAYNGRVYEK